jgi:hypothetical protein
LWQVERVLVDGQPIDVKEIHRISRQWSGRHQGNLAAGGHELTVEVACAYVDEAKLIGLDADSLEVKRWPKPRKQWLTKVSAPFTVYPSLQPIVGLDTDASRDPNSTGGIKIERLVVQAGRDGKKSIILKIGFTPELSVPLSCDVGVMVGGDSLHLGQTWIVRQGNSQTSGGSQFQAQIEKLDPAIRSADVILQPNPIHIERVPGVEKIWGKPIVIPAVPLERLDLDAGAGSEKADGQ